MAFGEQAGRLLRDQFENIEDLGKEVFSVFQAWRDGGVHAPVIITQPKEVYDPLIQAPKETYPTPPPTTPAPAIPPMALHIRRADSKTTSLDVHGNFWETEQDAKTGKKTTTQKPALAAALLGRIVSGNGKHYSVRLYENGPNAKSTQTVAALFPNINDDDQLPQGRLVLVIRSGIGTIANTLNYTIMEATWI